MEICCGMSELPCNCCPYFGNGCNENEDRRDTLHYLVEHKACLQQLENIQYLKKDFEEARDKHLAALKELKNVQDRAKNARWIPVSERMPENEEIMAVRCVTQKGVVTWNRAWYDGQFWHGSGSFAGVTHWMPISTEVE